MINFYLHAGSDNHGCEAIVRSTTEMLDEVYKLYSLNPDKDIKYGIDKICEIKGDIPTPYQRRSIKWLLSAIQTKICSKHSCRLTTLKLSHLQMQKAIKTAF